MVTERELYKIIGETLKQQFHVEAIEGGRLDKPKFEYYLEITSEGKFPEKILSLVPDRYDIIFSFLKKKNSPDLTGFVKQGNTIEFITIEIKNSSIKLDDVYQAKRYADLFQATHGFLISTKPIPTTIKKLCGRIGNLYIAGTEEKLKLARFDVDRGKIIENSWFPKSPFRYSVYV